MKAVLCKQFGMPEDLVLEDVPAPIPGPGEVLVDVHAAALNFPDVLMIQGKYQSQPPFPFSPAGEIAGVVAAAGAGVTRACDGRSRVRRHRVRRDRRAGRREGPGAAPIPDGMSFAEASGISTTYGTSYYALKQRAAIQPGETLLVLGAGGGVGPRRRRAGASHGRADHRRGQQRRETGHCRGPPAPTSSSTTPTASSRKRSRRSPAARAPT
jgi:NADPH:quinone reductase